MLILILAIIIIFWKGCEVTEKEKVQIIHTPKIDTVPGNFVVPEVKPNIAPKEEKVYKKKDTTLRKQAEKKDIIIDVKIEDGHLTEDVVDTLGQVTEKIIETPIALTENENGETPKEIVIAPEGVQVKEKTKAGKILQKIGKGAKKVGKGVVIGLAVVGVVAIVLVASGG
jgi:hypothetical protein